MKEWNRMQLPECTEYALSKFFATMTMNNVLLLVFIRSLVHHFKDHKAVLQPKLSLTPVWQLLLNFLQRPGMATKTQFIFCAPYNFHQGTSSPKNLIIQFHEQKRLKIIFELKSADLEVHF